MIDSPIVQRYTRRAIGMVTLALILVTVSVSETFGQGEAPQETAANGLQRRLADYLELRAQLAGKLKPLSPTPSAPELAARLQSLAAALREVRKNAKPGDLIPADGAELIRKAVADDLTHRTAPERRATLADVPHGPAPVINRTYPPDAPFATVPPLLLGQLPRLPDSLQYRYYSRHIVLLDGDVDIILDYVPDVLPPH